MDSIGIRELRQHASRYLERVKAGESIQITDRGRPVAVLSPVVADPLEAMIARGEATRAKGSWEDLPEPIAPRPGVPLPSEVLEQQRAERF